MRALGRSLQHVGEWKVELAADSPEGVFAEAARVIARAVGSASGNPSPWESVDLRARDAAALLVEWANELIGRGEIQQRAYDEVRNFAIDPPLELEDGLATAMRRRTTRLHLMAEVRGRSVSSWRSPIKAATYHDASMERSGKRWRGVILFDI
jgi:SHS2 domain-containing protein